MLYCSDGKNSGEPDDGCERGPYLIKQSEHVSQHVGNWHIKELSKVVQIQFLPLQLSGSVPILLQNLLNVLGFQPGTAKGNRQQGDIQVKFRRAPTNNDRKGGEPKHGRQSVNHVKDFLPPQNTSQQVLLAQQQGHNPQISSHLHTKLGIDWIARHVQSATIWVPCGVWYLVCPRLTLPSLLSDGSVALQGLSDSPQSPDQLGIFQQTGVNRQSQLAFCHSQLAVFKRIVCNGYPQGSEQSAEETTHRQINTNCS